MSDGNLLAPTKRAFIAQVLTQMPGLAASVEAAKRLSKVLRRDSAEPLDDVLAHTAGTELSKFALNLRGDNHDGCRIASFMNVAEAVPIASLRCSRCLTSSSSGGPCLALNGITALDPGWATGSIPTAP
jgi:hypothetical protein